MTDMESLDRAVEEAREELRKLLDDGGYSEPDLDRFEAAVSAKARAEAYRDCRECAAARSSEEAGNGGGVS